MRLLDLLPNTETLFDEAFKHPVMKIKPKAARPFPTSDDALKATLNAVEYAVIYKVAELVTPRLTDILTNQILFDGERKDSEDADSWDSAVDDEVESAIEEFVPLLSADWMGRHTIDSGIWLPDGVEKFGLSMGREVYKQLTFNLTPAKILSAAGIVQAEIEARLETYISTPTESSTMDPEEALAAVIAKIAAHVGKDYDIMAVYDDLDLASDGDESLGAGAAARLGLEVEDLEPLQGERLMNGSDAVQILADKLEEFFKTGAKKPAAKKAAAPKAEKAPAKPKAAPKAAAATAEGSVKAETLVRLKEACTFKDADTAQKLGVSRATFNNWVNGKTACELTGDQYTALRGEIVDRANALLESLAELDGTTAETVF